MIPGRGGLRHRCACDADRSAAACSAGLCLISAGAPGPSCRLVLRVRCSRRSAASLGRLPASRRGTAAPDVAGRPAAGRARSTPGRAPGAATGPRRPGTAPGRWPVPGGGPRPAVVRGWEPPARCTAGHRGVDLAARPGAPVRAVAAGRVSFAGPVAGRGVLSVELTGTGDPPLRTTYEPVRATVREGRARWRRARWSAACERRALRTARAGCLHWGLLRGGRYLDPLSLLPPWLLRGGPSRLLPVFGVPAPGRADRAARPAPRHGWRTPARAGTAAPPDRWLAGCAGTDASVLARGRTSRRATPQGQLAPEPRGPRCQPGRPGAPWPPPPP